MVLYFSATGNSEFAAERIGRTTGDEVQNLFEKIKTGDFSRMHSDRSWVVVVPTYAWRIPRIVQNWLENTTLSGNRRVYFVMTCGENVGNAGKYLKKLCEKKKMDYCGCFAVKMPENYIAMFTTPNEDEAARIVERAEGEIDRAARLIETGENFPQSAVSLGGRVSSSFVNKMFYPLIVHAKKFCATDACISCGRCVEVCPLSNVRLKEGRPVWGDRCTHCMACINRCPTEAIEYGTHSRGLPRYVC